MPATIVGSANGRSMTALNARRIGFGMPSSRTSTHAIAVPMTALMAATSSEATTVSSSALTAWRLDTACQKPLQPSSVDFATTAASGTSTIRLSQSVPRPRLRDAPESRDLLSGRDASILLDLRDRALVRVEELVVDLAPATEVVDGLQVRRGRELELLGDGGVDRA